MDRLLYANEKVEKGMAVALAFVIVFGGSFSFGISVAGLALTAYRVTIPIFFCYFLLRSNKAYFEDRYYRAFLAFLIIWILYGGLLAAVHGDLQDKNGLRELVQLCLSGLSFFCLTQAMQSQHTRKAVLVALRCSLWILVLIAIWEMSTGEHLRTSMYADPHYIDQVKAYYELPKTAEWETTIPTGIFYNPNDFAAFLAIFSPLLLPLGEEKLAAKVGNALGLSLIIGIIMRDDAWISFFSLGIGMILFLLLKKAGLKEWALYTILLIVSQRYMVGWIGKAVGLFRRLLGMPLSEGVLEEMQEGGGVSLNPLDAIAVQTTNAQNGYGSMYTRIETYLRSIRGTFTETYGTGFGPRGIDRYLQNCQEPGVLNNPHCFWLEILGNYGVVILVAFLALILYAFFQSWKSLSKSSYGRDLIVVILAMDVTLVFASFAPSGFLGLPYYWIPVAATAAVACERRCKIVRGNRCLSQ